MSSCLAFTPVRLYVDYIIYMYIIFIHNIQNNCIYIFCVCVCVCVGARLCVNVRVSVQLARGEQGPSAVTTATVTPVTSATAPAAATTGSGARRASCATTGASGRPARVRCPVGTPSGVQSRPLTLRGL